MTIPGKYRPEFAMLSVAFSAILLAVAGWAFFSAFGHALLRAAVGAVTAEAHLGDLLFLQKMALAVVIMLGAILALAFIALWSSHETAMAKSSELIRQLRLFARDDWRESPRPPSGDELDDVVEAANALARARRGNPAGGTAADVEEIKTHFLEIISHQLRTPLTAVRWNIEALLKGDTGPLSKRQQDLLRITSENYQGILAMLADWVEALEIERGFLHLNPEPIDTRPFMLAIAEEFKHQARLKRQRFTSSLARPLPNVHADKLKFRYLMSKLLSNAIGYTAEGGRIALRASAEGRSLRIEVSDSGVGIPYEEQPKIFDKFFRASNASLMQPNASGVGLFVARQLVEAHGGQIGFRSEEGRGTTFWVLLPAVATASAKK